LVSGTQLRCVLYILKPFAILEVVLFTEGIMTDECPLARPLAESAIIFDKVTKHLVKESIERYEDSIMRMRWLMLGQVWLLMIMLCVMGGCAYVLACLESVWWMHIIAQIVPVCGFVFLANNIRKSLQKLKDAQAKLAHWQNHDLNVDQDFVPIQEAPVVH